MGIVNICGYPFSGKSKIAMIMAEVIKEKSNQEVLIINSDRESELCEQEDKLARLEILSSLRGISKNAVTIVDSRSDNKGFRNQIFCIAREKEIPYIVFHVIKNPDEVIEEGKKRGLSNEVIEEYITKFDMPSLYNKFERNYIKFNFKNEIKEILIEKINDIMKILKVKNIKVKNMKEINILNMNYMEKVKEIIEKTKEKIKEETGVLKFDDMKLRLATAQLITIYKGKKINSLEQIERTLEELYYT